MANILDAIREELFSRLQNQTNWGRNQIKELYTEVERDVLSAQYNTLEILKEENAKQVDGFRQIFSSPVYKNIVQDISKPTPRPDIEYPFHDDKDIKKF